MSAGEKVRIDIEAFWAPEDLMPHDLSVVVQAEKSPVNIIVEHDHESGHFPNYKINPDVKIRPLDNSDKFDDEASEEEKVPDEEEAVDDQIPNVPSFIQSDGAALEDSFRYLPGDNTVSATVKLLDEFTFQQDTEITIDGRAFEFNTTLFFDGSTFKATTTYLGLEYRWNQAVGIDKDIKAVRGY